MKVRYFSTLFLILFISLLSFGGANAATITVTERTDSFDGTVCSLRNAIESVNTGADFGGCVHTGPDYTNNDTIILEGGAPYVVSLPDVIGGNVDGDLDINQTVVIQGAGIDQTTVTGGFPAGQETRIFNVCENCVEIETILITDLTVSNGGSFSEDGGGVTVEFNGNLTLRNTHIRDNIAEDGGGISNEIGSTLLLEQSLVTGNTADEEGGGIENSSELAINESTIDDNEAIDGGGITTLFGTFTLIDNSTISNNRAVGGIAQGGGGDGGGILIATSCDVSIIQNSTISTNSAAEQGGGIFVSSNACADAGVSVGAQGLDAGLFLFNDTITLNQALGIGGEGGGIWFIPQAIPFSSPGAAGLNGVGLANTILAQNEAENGPDCFTDLTSMGFNLLGSSSDCNLANGSPATHPDQVDVADPGLGPLQDNGGPTFTHGLFSDSLAIDTGNTVEGCMGVDFANFIETRDLFDLLLTRDQRNFIRPIAVNSTTPICDVGAFEFQAFDFTVTKDDGLGGEAIPTGTAFDYTITVTNNGPGAASFVTLDDPLPAGMEFVSVTPSQGACAAIGQVIGCDLGDLAVGETATITVTVIATVDGTFTNVVTITLTNEFQEQLTETAQVTTLVGGIFIEGSGVHCGLQPGAIHASPGFALMLGLMSVVIFGVAFTLRRKTHG